MNAQYLFTGFLLSSLLLFPNFHSIAQAQTALGIAQGVVLFGGDGDDEIHGGDGHDTIRAGNGNNEIFADGGNDNVLAGHGNDEIHGGDGRDTIRAGTGDNDIFGDGGDDDILAGDGFDTVTDFNPKGGDRIDLSGTGINAGHIRLFADGGDTLVTFQGTGGSIRLKNVSVAEINFAKHFAF